MAKISIVFGVLLIALGLTVYSMSDAEGPAKTTALIPSGFGVGLLLCGLISSVKPSLNKHVMHLAALIGLLGFVGALMRPIMNLVAGKSLTLNLPLIGQLGMAVLCAAFVALCVNSFIQARKNRQLGK